MAREFWSDIVTEKSWNALLKLKKLPIDFILVGGWAAYLWTKTHKSKDIDIVLSDFGALEFLKQNFDLRKNQHLKKYEIRIDDIDVDVYLQFFSGLAIPPEDMKEYTTKLEGIDVLVPEALIVLKQKAEADRRGSTKGEKDAIDIMTLLLNCDIDFKKYRRILEKYGLQNLMRELERLVKNFSPGNVGYLGLNPREFKSRKKGILEKIKKEK